MLVISLSFVCLMVSATADSSLCLGANSTMKTTFVVPVEQQTNLPSCQPTGNWTYTHQINISFPISRTAFSQWNYYAIAGSCAEDGYFRSLRVHLKPNFYLDSPALVLRSKQPPAIDNTSTFDVFINGNHGPITYTLSNQMYRQSSIWCIGVFFGETYNFSRFFQFDPSTNQTIMIQDPTMSYSIEFIVLDAEKTLVFRLGWGILSFLLTVVAVSWIATCITPRIWKRKTRPFLYAPIDES
eukprot:jgi/Galph1/4816/GphlegSOOS_G3474.1